MGITGRFGVPGENDNDRMLSAGNIYFKHRSLHKYTKVARGQESGEVKSMIDHVLVKKVMLHYVQNVRAVKG